MDSLFNNSPLSTNLSGGGLTKPAQSVPGSGIFSSIGNLLSAPSSANTLSLTGGASARSLLPSIPGSYTAPGFASALTPNVGLPQLPNTPSLSSQVKPGASPLMSTAYASTVPASTQQANNTQLNPNTPLSSIPGLSALYNQVQLMQQQANGLTPAPGTTSTKNFNVDNGNNPVYDSSYMSPGALQDLLDARKAKQQALMSGTNADGTPATNLQGSDSLLGQVAQQLYQSSLYTPQEQQLISQQLDLQNQSAYDILTAKRQIASMQESGQITKEQAASMIQDTQDRANARLADLNYNLSSGTAQLQALGSIRQNQTTALQGYLQALQPTQVSPGSTLYSPVTGQTMYQGVGASPQAIASYGQELAQSAIQQGTAQYNPDGSINYGYYNQLATQLLGGSGNGASGYGAQTGGVSTSGGQITSPSDPNFYNALPNTVAPAYRQLSSGLSYFDGSQLDSAGLGTARAISKQTGVPILNAQDVGALQDLQSVQNGLNTTMAIFKQLAPNSLAGKIGDTLTNPLSKLFSTDYGSLLKAYQTNKDSLFRQISAFAGSHPRLNTTEIQTQAGALPSLGSTPFSIDTLQDGLTKMSLIQQSINNIQGSIIPQKGGQYQIPQTNVGTGVVQTKVGAIPTNW